MRKLTFTSLVLTLNLICLSGCSTTVNHSLRAIGASYQCEREAANRPDEAQRLAECQNRLQLQREREREREREQHDHDSWSG